MHLEVDSSFEIFWAGLPTCWCIIMCIYIVILCIAVSIVVIGNEKVHLVFEVTL